MKEIAIVVLISLCFIGIASVEQEIQVGQDGKFIKMLKDSKSSTDRQVIEMEHINKDLTKAFPFLKILDSIIDWTTGIKWTIVKDTRNGNVLQATKIQWEDYIWRFRQKIKGEWWFMDNTPDNSKWKKEPKEDSKGQIVWERVYYDKTCNR